MGNDATLDDLQTAWCDAKQTFSLNPVGEPTQSCPLAKPDPSANSSKIPRPSDDIAEMMTHSPTLKKNIETLQKDGWTIRYSGMPGDLPGSYTSKDTKEIVVDRNKQGDEMAVTQTLSHETGHALYTANYVPVAGNTRKQYVDGNTRASLKDEGEATLMNAQIRNELIVACGPDIGIAGMQAAKYAKIAAKYPDAKDRDTARGEIADEFAKGEHPSTAPKDTYEKYYSDFYDKNYTDSTKPAKTK